MRGCDHRSIPLLCLKLRGRWGGGRGECGRRQREGAGFSRWDQRTWKRGSGGSRGGDGQKWSGEENEGSEKSEGQPNADRRPIKWHLSGGNCPNPVQGHAARPVAPHTPQTHHALLPDTNAVMVTPFQGSDTHNLQLTTIFATATDIQSHLPPCTCFRRGSASGRPGE